MSNHEPPHQSGPPGYQRPPQYVRPPAYDSSASYASQSASAPNGGASYSYPVPTNGHWQPPAPAKGSPPLWVGILILALAPVVAVGGIIISLVLGAQELEREFVAAEPGRTHQLEAGTTYTLYAATDEIIFASDCEVYDPDFTPIAVRDSYSSTPEEHGGTSYEEIGELTATSSGSYRFNCEATSDLLVIEGNGYAWMGLGSVLSVLGGGLLGIIGFALIVANRITASRRRQAAAGGRY